jgi:L-ascorbate metabolism protein UlaG (beta-lactamase superfamily)
MAVRLKWFPPSWLQIRGQGQLIYIDPAYMTTYFAKHPSRIEFSRWPDPIDGLPEELEKADVILVTHDHKDHCKDATVDRLSRSDTLVIGPKCCMKKLNKKMEVIQTGEKLDLNGAEVKTVEAYNTKQGSSTKKVHHKGNGVGYVLTVEGKTIYHAGDTDLVPEMRELGNVDVALLPIGGTFTLDVREAVEAAVTINPKLVVPMHHLRADPQEFKEALEARSDIRVILPRIGEIIELQ